MQMQGKEGEKGGVAQRDKGVAEWCTVKRTEKHSKRGSKRKGCQENIQNPKRSVVRHRNREGRHVQRHDSQSTLGQ